MDFCKTFRANLGALLVGDVDDDELAAFLAHEAECPACRDLHESRALLRSLISHPAADDRV